MNGHRFFALLLTMLTVVVRVRADDISAMAVSPDGSEIAYGTRAVKLRTLKTGAMRKEFRIGANSAELFALAFSPDGLALYSGDDDGHVIEYPVPGTELAGIRLKGHRRVVRALAISHDGAWMASGGNDNYVIVWDLTARKPLRQLEKVEDQIQALAISPAGDRLAAGDESGRLTVWDCATWRVVRRIKSGGAVNAVLFTPDGRQLVSAGDANSVQFWDAADGKLVREIPREENYISSLALSPDGRWLAAAGGQEQLRLWELSTGKLTLPIRHGRNVTVVAFSRDGTRLITVGDDNGIHNVSFPIESR